MNLGMSREECLRRFEASGFVIVRGFVSAPIAQRLLEIARTDPAISAHAHGVLDAAGRESRLTLWYQPGDDAFGQLSCCAEMVDTMSLLLGGRASFFHAKLMQKLPGGGRWEWHQDYGYWYDDGFLSPHMGSCFVALEAATPENGCLQVVPGSHHFGRIHHGKAGEQTGADPARVAALRARLGVRSCTLEAGDALFFHANLLHMSGPNESSRSRLALITSFFREDNEVPDSADPRFRNKRYAVTRLADLRPSTRAASGD